MKKNYYQPKTEIVVLNPGERLTWGGGANGSNTGTHTGGKQNDFFFEEETAENSDEDFWGTDPWDIKYSLWDED